MKRENGILYVETDAPKKKKPSKSLDILSLVFGIASIILSGPLGIILGGIAQGFATVVLNSGVRGGSKIRAKAGQITGSVGLCLSIVAVSLSVLILITGVWLAVLLIG